MNQKTLWAGGVVAALLAAYLAVPLLFGDQYWMSTLIAALVIAGIAVPWAMLAALGGLVSFGHAAFFGLGAYASALLTMKLGWSVLPAMLAGGVAATLSSILVIPALRLKGPYFALAMLAYAEIFRIVVTEAERWTGGAGGLLGIARLPSFSLFGATFDLSSKIGSYLVVLTMVCLSVCIYAWLKSSVYGFALAAMGESEDATKVLGVHTTLLKVVVLGLSAFLTGLIGAFNAHSINFLEPDYAFAGTWSLLPTVGALVGGFRYVTGPVLGAMFVYLCSQLLFKPLIGHGHEIVYGILLVIVVLVSPEGMLSLFSRKGRVSASH